MVLAKFSSVVTCRDSKDARRGGSGMQTVTHGGLNGLEIQAINHDFVNGLTTDR